ncbi:MAG: glycine cleavage system aminomethyltransferase GcvT [Nitrospirae bacterium]|nr:glycine cleavage system aminomethyltransferase GcvT [Nitrospirota bacterium]
MNRTVLYEAHKALNAQFVEFAGWEMPLSYSGVLEEHKAVRTAAGLFDVSHMGRIQVDGQGGKGFLQYLSTADVAALRPGQACYTLFCNNEGGIIDDLIIYKLNRASYLVCVNAANREKCLTWIRTNSANFSGVTIEDISGSVAQIAIQGPRSLEILQEMTNVDLAPVKLKNFIEGRLCGMGSYIARTGFTGERGYEIFIPAVIAHGIWESVMKKGEPYDLKPAGLGARDTLRLEMGYPLHGNDMDETTTPIECSLERAVDFKKGDFIGKEAILRHKEKGIERKLAGFELLQKGIPRHGCRIYSNGKTLGVVTSGNFSPTLKKGIGLGFVLPQYSAPGTEILIDIRGKAVLAVVAELPFYKKMRKK